MNGSELRQRQTILIMFPNNLPNIFSSPLIHPVVDDGVDAAVGHGQPVEQQVHVLGEPGLHSSSTMYSTNIKSQSRNMTLECFCSIS